jgi:hypothetical protein
MNKQNNLAMSATISKTNTYDVPHASKPIVMTSNIFTGNPPKIELAKKQINHLSPVRNGASFRDLKHRRRENIRTHAQAAENTPPPLFSLRNGYKHSSKENGKNSNNNQV